LTPQLASPVRVLLLSAVGTRINPYIGLLRDGLAAAGADVQVSGELPTPGGLRPHVIHLHWLDRYDLPAVLRFGRGRPGLLRRLLSRGGNLPVVYALRRRARLAGLFRRLVAFQRDGGILAYTVHNLDPHEEASRVEQWGGTRLVRLADVVHVHDESTAAELATRYGRTAGVAVIPHGHYIGSYPNTLSRGEARARLGLPPDAFVYACIGLLRPYKGLEELIPAFRSLPGAHLRLLLAGKPGTPEYGRTLAALAAGDARIRLDPQFVPPEDVQTYYNAADVCVLPYRQITTSGAALLAFSFGLPVVAPAIGAFPALVTPARGVLYDPAQPAGLTVALMAAQQHDWQAARLEIMSWIGQFDWGDIGARLLAAYAEAGL
jgi:beta-1,4-mannosyltransferase